MIRFVLGLTCLLAATVPGRAAEIVLYGAGSLRDALTAVAAEHAAASGTAVKTEFGPSGLMREKIQGGGPADLFASADMDNAQALSRGGWAPTVMFTRNALCAFAKPEAGLTSANFVERLLDPAVRIGTSTPLADPGGDYAWAMFRKMDGRVPGAFATLDGKAQKIVGGTLATADPDPIATAFREGRIDVMIGYCSGAAQRRRATPDVVAVEPPAAVATGPEYGLVLRALDKPDAVALAMRILSPAGQAVLARHGFTPVGLPAAP